MGFHEMSGPDNGTFAFDGRPEVATCDVCKGVLDKMRESLRGVRIHRRKYDVSNTYDGACIVTERFKQICESNRLTGAVLRQLPDDPGYYVLWSDVVVEYDPEEAGSRLGERCGKCGKLKWATSGRCALKPGSVVLDLGFAQTDLWFAGIGGYDERCPTILCGDGAAKVLREAKLKGLEFPDEVPPVRIPEAIWSQALPTLKKAASKTKAKVRGPSAGLVSPPPRVSLRLRSGAVITDVEVNWRREILHEGFPSDPRHTPEYDFDAEMDQGFLEYEAEDIVGIAITLRSFLGLKKQVFWFGQSLRAS